MSRANSAIGVDSEATGTMFRMMSLTVGSVPGAMLGSNLLEHTELRGYCLRQIARDNP